MNHLENIARTLLELANKATPGEWQRNICQVDKAWLKGRLHEGVSAGDLTVCICNESDADAEYIAACNPQNIAILCKAILKEALQ